MLNMETQKVGRNVQGSLWTEVEPGTNIFDDRAIRAQQKKNILPAFRELVDEWVKTIGDRPTAASITSTDQSMIAEAYNIESELIFNEQANDPDFEGTPVRRKKVDRWDATIEIDGITIKTQCAITDGIVTLHQFE